MSWDFDDYDCDCGAGVLTQLHLGEGSVAFGGMVTLHLLGNLEIQTGTDPKANNIAFVKKTNRVAGEFVRLVHNPRTQLWYEVD